MKKLLILPLFMLLTACVTYYYPKTALKDGIYYAEDDPSYVVYSGTYAGAAYYPWVSLDYFYLAYYPYRYYGYYSPWYISHFRYPYDPALRPYYASCTAYGGCQPRNRRSRRGDHYAGNDRSMRSSGSRSMKSEARGSRSRSASSSSSNKMARASSRESRD